MSSRKRVEKVMAISAVSSSTAVDIGYTTSITSDPENTWVAKRQSAINAALERRIADQGDQNEGGFEDSPIGRNGAGTTDTLKEPASTKKRPSLTFSGESERIGEGNWDEKTSFGKHVGYL